MTTSEPSIQGIYNEITSITGFLVEKGFATDQNFPVRKGGRRDANISFPDANYARMLRNVPYDQLYQEQRDARSYNVLMLDGAMIQMSYQFDDSSITKCRLAFLPSPNLEAYQNDPELYDDQVMYAEALMRQVVTVPVRFDFDDREGVAIDIDHPRSHLTLGQYSNCRIPVSAPVPPGIFIGLILRSFYNTAITAVPGGVPCATHRWQRTITAGETGLPHVVIP